MKHAEAEQWLKEQLAGIYENGEATNIADLVMEHATGLNKSKRSFKKEEPLTEPQLQELKQYNQRLLINEPVQYVLGEAHFYKMKLFVDNNVLIPRPETEELVEWIVNDVKKSGLNVFERKGAESDETKKLKILDVGTGSGCIALALKKEMPKAEVWGCDVSDAALNVARRNGSELDIRVDFQGIDFLDSAQQRSLPTVDIVVSNPPYIPLKDKESMHKNVVDHEPHTALFVQDNDPIIFYKALANFGKIRLYEDGCIYTEIHEGLAKDVIKLFTAEGYNKIELRKDMQGKDRMIKAVRSF